MSSQTRIEKEIRLKDKSRVALVVSASIDYPFGNGVSYDISAQQAKFRSSSFTSVSPNSYDFRAMSRE